MLVPVAYGFVARLAADPTFSSFGRLATQVIVPMLPFEPRLVDAPEAIAQGIGAVLSSTALVAHVAFGATSLASVLLGAIMRRRPSSLRWASASAASWSPS